MGKKQSRTPASVQRPGEVSRIKFRPTDDPEAEQDLEVFVSEANSTLASLDEAEGVSQETLNFEFNI